MPPLTAPASRARTPEGRGYKLIRELGKGEGLFVEDAVDVYLVVVWVVFFPECFEMCIDYWDHNQVLMAGAGRLIRLLRRTQSLLRA